MPSKEIFLRRGSQNLTLSDAPLAATLGRLSAAGGEGLKVSLSARSGVPDEPGWILAADLFAAPDLLGELMVRVGRGYGTDDRPVVGTMLLRSYLWRILAPAVAAFLAERRLPDLHAGNVAFRYDERGALDLAFAGSRLDALPDDPAAGHPDVVVVPTEDAMLARMRDALAGSHLSALIPALRDLRVRRGKRALWLVAVDVISESFLLVGRDLGREPESRAFAERLLGGPLPLSGPTNYFIPKNGGAPETTRTRNVCCLYYKLGNGACATCPRLADEHRRIDSRG